MNRKLSVQLYSVRDETAKDFAGTMKSLAKIGFAGVELAGFGNLKTAGDVKKACDDAGVVVSGMHVALDRLEKELPAVIEESLLFNKAAVICPWLGEHQRKNEADYRKLGLTLTKVGETLRPHGIDVAYHNHAFEFVKFDGRYALDILFEETSPHIVKAEIDVYWVQHGGLDPAAYITKYANRTPLVHLKDMARGDEKRFAPVGTGILDFPKILKACENAGVKWGIVEQDNCYDLPPLEAMKIAFDNLQKM